MLDYVDEHDHVLGQASRDEVHAKALMHRATHIILLNSNRQYFVQLRAMHKDNNPGVWDSSAAGHVDAGESYLDCASRELAEELGVRKAPSDFVEIGRMGPSEANGYEFVRIYGVVSDQSVTFADGEVVDGRWLSESELEHWLQQRPQDFANTFGVIWDTIREWRDTH